MLLFIREYPVGFYSFQTVNFSLVRLCRLNFLVYLDKIIYEVDVI